MLHYSKEVVLLDEQWRLGRLDCIEERLNCLIYSYSDEDVIVDAVLEYWMNNGGCLDMMMQYVKDRRSVYR